MQPVVHVLGEMPTSTAVQQSFASMQVHRHNDRLIYTWCKRLLDILVSVCALFTLAPLFLVIAVLIKLDSKGPVFYAQERIGFDPATRTIRPFRFFKFRSMYVNNDPTVHQRHVTELIKHSAQTVAQGCSVKMAGDRRITRVGASLRRTSLDELPQLFNVLRGEMSLVGPRPPLPYEVACYQEWHKCRLSVIQGMTGWWQVMGRNQVSFDEMVATDLYYVEHQSLVLDLKILLLTPWAVITGRGAG